MSFSCRFITILILICHFSFGFLALPSKSEAFNSQLDSVSAFFLPNPMMRNCNLAGGTSIVVKVGKDQMLLCHIGSSFIGSLELFLYKTEKKSAEGINYFLNGVTDANKCAFIETISDLDNQFYEICFFNDGSMIDKATFEKGIKHTDNNSLKKVLTEIVEDL